MRRLVIPAILDRFEKTKNLSPKKSYEWGGYILSLVHALGLSFWGLHRMKNGIALRPPGFSSRTLAAWSMGYAFQIFLRLVMCLGFLFFFVCSYFIEDAWAARHEWIARWEFAAHHFLAISVQSLSMWHVPFIRFSVLWALVEWSTIFLDLMWYGFHHFGM